MNEETEAVARKLAVHRQAGDDKSIDIDSHLIDVKKQHFNLLQAQKNRLSRL